MSFMCRQLTESVWTCEQCCDCSECLLARRAAGLGFGMIPDISNTFCSVLQKSSSRASHFTDTDTPFLRGWTAHTIQFCTAQHYELFTRFTCSYVWIHCMYSFTRLWSTHKTRHLANGRDKSEWLNRRIIVCHFVERKKKKCATLRSFAFLSK